MKKPGKQTYTLEMYLKKIKEMDIRSDQDVQRLSGAWNNAMINELVVSVLNGEYIPPVILAEEQDSQKWVVDGLQRSTALMLFRYGKHRLTSSIEEPVISYRAKARDAEGNPRINGCGDVIREDRTFDLRNKTYEKLPGELKKQFDEYQIETVIHEGYTMKEISKLVRRYNSHKAMNVSQRAFTHVDNYARRIRTILKREFFTDCTGYTRNERKNGTMERIIMESVMLMFHADEWKKPGQIGEYINENASEREFDILEEGISRLEKIITEDLYSVFNSRDSFILFALFHKFTALGCEDGRFADFLRHFMRITEGTDTNGFYGLDKNCPTKDKTVVLHKLDRLETLMREFPGITGTGKGDGGNLMEFVRENAAPYATDEDIRQYLEVLETLTEKIDPSHALLNEENRPSLAALVAYSFETDTDLDDWITDFAGRNDTYIADQKENYGHMVDDLKRYMEHKEAA